MGYCPYLLIVCKGFVLHWGFVPTCLQGFNLVATGPFTSWVIVPNRLLG